MKAAIRTQYGNPEVIKIAEVDKPQPKPGEVLVKVYYTTVNRTDVGVLTGLPRIFRLFIGPFKPRLKVTGTDFAGIVEAAGDDVKKFKAGDRVFGFNDEGLQSHAQYLTLNANSGVGLIPDKISFEEAAASIEGAHYAYNFITKVNLKPGDKVMVNGATGAIGSAAIQFLKYFGIEVTATCPTPYLERVKSLGADHVIDYLKEDFTQREEKFDFVFDSVGKSSFGKCKPILKSKGVYISSELGPRNENPFLAMLAPFYSGKKVYFPFPVKISRSIEFIKDRLIKDEFRPLIDREYSLGQIREAFDYVMTGEKIGNVILRITEDQSL